MRSDEVATTISWGYTVLYIYIPHEAISILVVDDATKGGQRRKPWPSYPKHEASTAATRRVA